MPRGVLDLIPKGKVPKKKKEEKPTVSVNIEESKPFPAPEESEKRKEEAQAFLRRREKLRSKGLSMEEATARAEEEAGRQKTPEEVKAAQQELGSTFEERGVFKETEQERIIPPEQENLGVMVRILKSLVPKSVSKALKEIDTMGGLLDFEEKREKGKPISQAEITTFEEDLKNVVEIETSTEIDTRLEDTEEILTQNGIPLGAILTGVGAVGLAGIVREPISEFVGTDGQIKSLEVALSQYNEMMTIPARAVDSGSLDPMTAFDKYDRMEENLLALEQQLKLSALTSSKVALALRGRAIEARLLKLKEKLQEGRGRVAAAMAAEAFGEKKIPESVAFLRRLQNEKKEL